MPPLISIIVDLTLDDSPNIAAAASTSSATAATTAATDAQHKPQASCSQTNSDTTSGTVSDASSSSAEQPNKKKRRRKLLSFAPEVRVRSVTMRKYLSDEERAAVWYSPTELLSMRQLAIQTVIHASLATSFDLTCDDDDDENDAPQDSSNFHGLEGMFRPVARQRRLLKQNLRETIQLQQQLELVSGPDPEWLAILYSNMTSASRARAHQLAVDHERSVQGI